MHGNALTFSEQHIASIIYDTRCGMTDVAFRTAPPIGGPSCYWDGIVGGIADGVLPNCILFRVTLSKYGDHI